MALGPRMNLINLPMSAIALGCMIVVAVSAWGVRQHAAEPAPPQPDRVATTLASRAIFPHAVYAVAFHPTQPIVAAGTGDGRLILWNHDDNTSRVITAHESWTFCIAFSSDGSRIASGGGDQLIKLWNAATGELVRTFQGHKDDVHGLAITPDDKFIISAGDDRMLIRWNLEDATVVYERQVHQEQITSLALSPDGALVATGGRDDLVRIFSSADGQPVRMHDASDSLAGHLNDVLHVAFSPDGGTLASASYDTTINLWNVQTGEKRRTIKHHKDRVFAVAFSPDGAVLASGGEDLQLMFADPKTGATISGVKLKSDVSRLAFSHAGDLIAVTSSAGTVTLLSSKGPQLKQLNVSTINQAG